MSKILVAYFSASGVTARAAQAIAAAVGGDLYEIAPAQPFLESCDFSGKAMVPFATSGGSAMPPAERHLREQYPAFTWKAGQLVTPRTAGAWAQSALGR